MAIEARTREAMGAWKAICERECESSRRNIKALEQRLEREKQLPDNAAKVLEIQQEISWIGGRIVGIQWAHGMLGDDYLPGSTGLQARKAGA